MAVGSTGIIFSRITGLIRDMVFARFWGTSTALGAFVIAFTIPNLFRRFFGEGALTEGFVPLFNEKLQNEGKKDAFLFLSQITSVLVLALTAICAIGVGVAFLLRPLFPSELAALTLRLLPLLLPYLIFICLAGFFAGVLNSFDHFSVPAFAPMLLNLALIAATIFLCPRLEDIGVNAAYGLAAGVLVAGLLQVLVLLPVLRRFGFRFAFAPSLRSSGVRELLVLVIPSMAAAGIYQINVLCDRLVAGWIGAGAVTSLYYSERLVYLPIGVFAVALTSACLPVMSKAFAEDKHDEMVDALLYSTRHILFLSLPCVLGLMLLGRQAIDLVYRGGEFDRDSLHATLGALLYYAPGIPAFAAVKIIRSGFFSRKNTRTPMKVSLFCLVLNIGLNLSLMIPLQQRGIALATTISAYVNCLLLLVLLYRELKPDRAHVRSFLLSLAKQAAALLGAGLAMYFTRFDFATIDGTWGNAMRLLVPGAIGALTYFILSIALACPELRELASILKRRHQESSS